MTTTIEIASRRLRLCRYSQGRLLGVDSFPIDEDDDPILALREAKLPDGLGGVRIVMHHHDMLLKIMTQPSCPPDRLQKIVEFELRNLVAGDTDNLATWHLLRIAGTTDQMRILVLIAKRTLIKELDFALAQHGGRLAGLVHPGIGLYHAYLAQVPEERRRGDVVLMDIGGKAVHTVFTRNGELVFLRTNHPGMRGLLDDLEEMRGIGEDDVRTMIGELGNEPPEDVRDLVRRHAGRLVTVGLTANLRFGKAQLHLADYEPAAIYISGTGGQVPGLCEALGERAGHPVRILNPFAGISQDLGAELDPLASLPSPWCPVIGGAVAEVPELDAMAPIREEKRGFWLSSGALRVAAVAAVVLVLLATVRQYWSHSSLGSVNATLDDLVPAAKRAKARMDGAADRKGKQAARLAFLASHRRPARVVVEILDAIGRSIVPGTIQVRQREVTVRRSGTDTVQVRLSGICEGGGGMGPDEVFAEFKRRLRERYPLIDGPITNREKPEIDANYRLSFDVAMSVKAPVQTTAPGSPPDGR